MNPDATAMPWPTQALRQALAPLLPGALVEVLPRIDSTNSELMRRFRASGRALPTLLVAEQQDAGRGRLGRTWHSQSTGSLTFSLGLPLAPADWSGLSLVVGLSVAQSLDPAGTAVQLKWPNDMWVHGRKLGGILVETANAGEQRYVIVGVGLNIAPPELPAIPAGEATQLPASVPPTSLQALDARWGAPAALLALAAPLVRALQTFEVAGFAPFHSGFAARDALAGREVQLSDGRAGLACGVSAQGVLRVQTAHGLQDIHSADISVRPAEALHKH